MLDDEVSSSPLHDEDIASRGEVDVAEGPVGVLAQQAMDVSHGAAGISTQRASDGLNCR
jgi:hypothetical protein